MRHCSGCRTAGLYARHVRATVKRAIISTAAPQGAPIRERNGIPHERVSLFDAKQTDRTGLGEPVLLHESGILLLSHIAQCNHSKLQFKWRELSKRVPAFPTKLINLTWS